MIEQGKKLSVVMPGYNEGSSIYKNLLETIRVLHGMANDFEIIFVNDGSKDDTLQNAQRAADECGNIKIINCQTNCGKGNALKTGVEEASGDYIAFLDADLDLHPSQLKRFIEIMEEKNADAVIASKWHPESKVNYPKRRVFLSIGYYLLLMVLFRLNLRDTQTGLKLFKAPVIKPVMRKILVKRFAYDIEVLTIINHMNYRIADAPITLNFSREDNWGRIQFKDIYHMVNDTLAVFYRLYILKYYDRS